MPNLTVNPQATGPIEHSFNGDLLTEVEIGGPGLKTQFEFYEYGPNKVLSVVRYLLNGGRVSQLCLIFTKDARRPRAKPFQCRCLGIHTSSNGKRSRLHYSKLAYEDMAALLEKAGEVYHELRKEWEKID